MINSVQYVDNSRIDGYPIYRIPKNIEGRIFMDCVEEIKDHWDDSICVEYLKPLEGLNNFFVIKIHLDKEELDIELKKYKNNLRKQKIIKLNG